MFLHSEYLVLASVGSYCSSSHGGCGISRLTEKDSTSRWSDLQKRESMGTETIMRECRGGEGQGGMPSDIEIPLELSKASGVSK